MTKISKSPDRHIFQKKAYIKRCEEKGTEPNTDYINMYETFRELDEKNITNPEWQQDNLEYDLRSTEWILTKVRASDTYAQNLYAAMCNMEFVKNTVWPVLKNQRWSCSWRHSGGIIADMREQGDYIDWYCSGIRGDADSDVGDYVGEGVVTDEIRADLLRLGWIAVEWEND